MAEANNEDDSLSDNKNETKSPRPESKDFLEIDEDLSNEIALAVASIVAESKLYHDEDEKNNNATKSWFLTRNKIITAASDSATVSSIPSAEKMVKAKKKSSKGKLIHGESVPSATAKGKVKKKKPKVTDSTSDLALTQKKSATGINGGTKKKKKKAKGEEDVNASMPLNSPHIPFVISNRTNKSFFNSKPEISTPSTPVLKPLPPAPPSGKDANTMEVSKYLNKVQSYFDQLGYEREGEPKIVVNMRLSMKHLMSTAKDLIRAGQPIKCLHALIMAVHFTNSNPVIERFPLHFKSEVGGRHYKHVVLGLYAQGNFGALGISRDPGLQDKPPTFARLSDLIHDFHRCYVESGHSLLEVKIGPIITHDPHSLENINWKLGKIPVSHSPAVFEAEVERVSKKLRAQMGLACLRCVKVYPGATGNDSILPFNNGPAQRSKSLAGRSSGTNENKINLNATSRSRPIPIYVSGSNSKTKIKAFK